MRHHHANEHGVIDVHPINEAVPQAAPEETSHVVKNATAKAESTDTPATSEQVAMDKLEHEQLEETKAPFLEHLEELRWRLWRAVVVLLIATIGCFVFHADFRLHYEAACMYSPNRILNQRSSLKCSRCVPISFQDGDSWWDLCFGAVHAISGWRFVPWALFK